MQTNTRATATRAGGNGRTSIRPPYVARRNGIRLIWNLLLICLIAFSGQGHASPGHGRRVVDRLMSENDVSLDVEYIPILNSSKAISFLEIRANVFKFSFGQRIVFFTFNGNLCGGLQCLSRAFFCVVDQKVDFVECQHLNFRPSCEASRWCLAKVRNLDFDGRLPPCYDIVDCDPLYADIGPKLLLGRTICGLHSRSSGVGASTSLFHRAAGQQERPEQRDGAYAGKDRLYPSDVDLIIGRISSTLCGNSRPLLGHEIVGLMLLGALCAFFGALGLYRIFDDPNRERKRSGWLLALVGIPLTFTFYGWARLGFPGSFWGLCG